MDIQGDYNDAFEEFKDEMKALSSVIKDYRYNRRKERKFLVCF